MNSKLKTYTLRMKSIKLIKLTKLTIIINKEQKDLYYKIKYRKIKRKKSDKNKFRNELNKTYKSNSRRCFKDISKQINRALDHLVGMLLSWNLKARKQFREGKHF